MSITILRTSVILIFNVSFIFSKVSVIEETFHYCLPTTDLIDSFDSNFDEFLNDFNVFKIFSREYYQIKLPDNEILSIYSLNGNLYLANCSLVTKIWVPSLVDLCTDKILVFISENFKSEHQLFLNQNNKIISNEGKIIDCLSEEVIFKIGNYKVRKFSNNISITIFH